MVKPRGVRAYELVSVCIMNACVYMYDCVRVCIKYVAIFYM